MQSGCNHVVGRPIVHLDKIAAPLTVLAPPVRLSVPRERQNIRNIRNRLHGHRFACFACFGLIGGTGDSAAIGPQGRPESSREAFLY